jgi:Abortive infection alpha
VGDSQSQKAGEGSTLIQAGGNVSIGLSYADVKGLIAEERERIVQQVWERAQEMLREAGIEPGPVPMKTLIPLLQYASLEDEGCLQERWAALLANAANPVQDPGKRVIHVSLLKELSAIEVRFLDTLYDYVVERLLRGVRSGAAHGLGWEVEMDFILEQSHKEEYFHISFIDNLERLNLLRRSTSHQIFLDKETITVPGPIEETSFYFTELAFFLVEACRPPQPEGDE